MKTLPVFTSAVIGMIATSSAATFNFTLQDAFKVGLFVENEATFGNSESEGTVVVGGTLTTGGSPWQVRLREGAYLVNSAEGNPSSPNDDFGLIVRNGMTFGTSPGVRMSASVAYGGTVTPDTSYISFVSLGPGEAPGGTPFLDRVVVPGSTVNMTQAFNDLKTMSATIAAMAGPIVDGSPTPLASIINNEFLMEDPVAVTNLAVFNRSFYLYNVSASNIDNKLTNLVDPPIFDNTKDIIVFNIINDIGPGATLDFRLIMGTGDLTSAGASNPWADNILWNISDPTITFASEVEFVGTLLAPNSKFIQGGPSVEGAFIVGTYDGSGAVSGVGELHPISGLTLIADSVVPEPTSALAGALLSLGLMRRKRD